MKIIFIGTSSGETSRVRNHSSLLIESDNYNLLIDSGEGISKALLNTGIAFDSIDAILLTHYHADHFAGLPSLLTQMKIHGRNRPLQIITHSNLIDTFENFLIASYLFKEKLGFELSILPFEFGVTKRLHEKISFMPKQNTHLAQSNLLKNYPAEIFVSSSLMLNLDSQKVFYTSDIGSADDLFLFEYEKIDLMISECTHIDLDQIFKSFKKLNSSELLLMHFSDEMLKVLETKINNLLPGEQAGIKICFDGMIKEIH